MEASASQAHLDPGFYLPPDPFPEGEHGDVIRTHDLTGPAALKAAARNELVLYRSTSMHDEEIAVSGIIALPKAALEKRAIEGAIPVISWAHGTLGCADRCAPSRDSADQATHIFNQAPHPLLNAFIRQGWAVVMTDYEGLGTPGRHPYLLGISQARGILDIVRAARQLHPVLSDRFAVVGHSQGGQAALFAGHHRDWTPELRLRGVGAMAPPSSIKALLLGGSTYDGYTPGLAFTPLFLAGAIAGDPTIEPADVLQDEALCRWAHVDDRGRLELSEPESWGGIKGTEQLLHPKGGERSTDAFFAQLDAMHPDLDIGVPVRIVQAVEDNRVNLEATRSLVAQLISRNGMENVVYDEYPVISEAYHDELSFHFGTITTDIPAMIRWIADRLGTA